MYFETNIMYYALFLMKTMLLRTMFLFINGGHFVYHENTFKLVVQECIQVYLGIGFNHLKQTI